MKASWQSQSKNLTATYQPRRKDTPTQRVKMSKNSITALLFKVMKQSNTKLVSEYLALQSLSDLLPLYLYKNALYTPECLSNTATYKRQDIVREHSHARCKLLFLIYVTCCIIWEGRKQFRCGFLMFLKITAWNCYCVEANKYRDYKRCGLH